MDRSIVEQQLNHTIQSTAFADFGTLYRGKVRDTYQREDCLVLVASDRISAFDHVLRQTIPFKGQVLNRVAAYFFEHTADIIQNHILSVPDPNVTVAKLCKPFPIEFVVRGYLAGHAWREYSAGKRVLCGKSMPEGLRQNSAFPSPILTPATKAEEGHDEDISREEILQRGIISETLFDQLEDIALRLFDRGSEMAKARGLILVDTKYEMGLDQDGEICLIDEVHTPDSSRYFYANTYEQLLAENKPQRQLSKEFVREWLMDHGFQGKDGQTLPDIPDSFRMEIANRYVELYEQITGSSFVPDTHRAPVDRVRQVLDGLFG
ncbi:MAG: phosphoribosylaminoimidazolesuccinocarboxamide synthase [Rhodothermales bacterium]